MVQSDVLSQQLDLCPEDKQDNVDKVLLLNELFQDGTKQGTTTTNLNAIDLDLQRQTRPDDTSIEW